VRNHVVLSNKYLDMEKIKKTFRVVTKILEWTIFGILVFTFLVVLSPLLPTKKYIYTYIVATGSMSPTIKAGSIAIVKPAKVEALKKGDIITFTSPRDAKQTILHRIFEVKKSGKFFSFLTKGDNNNDKDSWTVPSVLIKEQLITSIPYLGQPATFLKTRKGFILLIVIPAIILALLQIKTIKEGINEEVEKRTKKAMESMKKKKKNPMLNVIILAFILNAFVYLGVNNYVKALFTSTVNVSGISISVIDFIPPTTPAGLNFTNPSLPCGSSTNSYTLTADWNDSIAHGSKWIDHYEYESYNPPSGVIWGPIDVTLSEYSGAFTLGEGTYGFRVRAVDNLGYKSDWSSPDFSGSCQVTYSIPKPIVSIDESFGHKTNGYECGVGSALTDDGLKIDVENWKSGYTLQAHYKIAGGGYGGWFNLYDGIWGSGSLTVIGDHATFTILNTGDSPSGAAGWEARVLDSSLNPFPSIGTSDYIITTDLDSLACNGTMQMGYDTAETGPQAGVGTCPIFTKDTSQNGGASSLQVLKWTAINEATQYRITPYRKDGINWPLYGSQYILNLTDSGVSVSGNIIKYQTWATTEYTTAYFIEGLDGSGNVVGQTTPQDPPFTCTFTVDRTKPTSIILPPPGDGTSHIANYVQTTVWDGTINGTASDNLSEVSQVELSIKYNDGFTDKYWDGDSWETALETTYRLLTTGTSAWTYILSDHSAGTYTITSHATDNANNVENSFVLTLVVISPSTTPTPAPTEPEVNLTLSEDKKTISFAVENIAGYNKLSYELTYNSFNDAKGILGSDIDISQVNEFSKDGLDLATCSGSICTYDENVNNLKLVVTLFDKDGKETKLEKSL